MKKDIFNKSIIITFLLTLLSMFANGESSKNIKARNINSIELQNSKTETIRIKCSVNNYSKQSVITEKGEAFVINAEDGSMLLIEGAPDLPKFTTSVIIPNTAEMQIKLIDSEFIEIENIDIAPSKGNIKRNQDPNSINYKYGEVYTEDAFFPKNIAKLNNPYILRQYRGQTVMFQPFRYNPVSKTLRIYTEITVEVSPIPGKKGTVNIIDRDSKSVNSDTEYKNIYKNHFLNYSNNSKYTPLEEQGNLLIISPTEYMNAMEDFVIWKKQKGIQTELVELSQIGSSADNIKNFIADYYNNKGLTYVLLIGDGEDIPSIIVDLAVGDTPQGHSDNAYGYITGDDSYPEVFIGRFSAESVADVETQVQRTIHYERDITESDTWFDDGVGIASAEGGGSYSDDGETDAQHMENIRQDLLGYGYSDVKQIYDPGASAASVSEAVNSGVGIIDYIGHGLDNLWGTTYFTNYQVDNLVNENKLPFIISVACLNGKFHGQTCFAESWLRATNNGNPTGAVAMIASTINQNWAPPMDAQDEMIDILIESVENNIKRTFGGITFNGSMHMLDEYGAESVQDADTWTIFGDPSLNVRTKTPVNLNVSHNDILYMGEDQFVINGDEGAFVSLTLNNEIIGTGVISDGTSIINFEPIEVHDTLKVTVTAYNKVTYITGVPILPANSPYIIVNNFTINDILGNNNGIADFEENINLNISFENITDAASGFDATNVMATISTDDLFVSLIDDTVSVGDISGGTESLKTNAFEVKINSNIPDQHILIFNVEIEGDYLDSTYTWNTQISTKVNAPKLITAEVIVDDSDTGNNNGILDSGETANIIIPVKNEGHIDITDVMGELAITLEQGSLVVNSGVFNAGVLAIGVDSSFVFNVTASTEAATHTMIEMELNIIGGEYGQYNSMHNKVVFIGGPREYLISNGGVITTCYGYFLDSGGKDENYSNNENYTVTIKPEAARSFTSVNFTEFDIESSNGGNCYDELYVYDGENIDAELIGVYCNANTPDVITATNPVGALTFVFNSDNDFSKAGWNAEISCVDATDNLVIFNVTDGSNPINNASILVDSKEYITDQNGQISFYIGNGKYDYTVKANGFIDFEGKLDPNGEDITENVALVTEKYNITFKINDENANPLNAKVTLNGTTLSAVNGIIIFSDLVYKLEVPYTIEFEGYATVSDNIDVTRNKILNINMKLNKYNVNFIIKNEEVPLEGIYVTVKSENQETYYKTTDSEGLSLFNLSSGLYYYTITGTAYNKVEDSFNLTDSDKDININMELIATGVNDLDRCSFNIYPNPSNGNFFIDISNTAKNTSISIVNSNGKVILKKNIMNNLNNVVNLSGQPNGIYFIQINMDGEIFTEKLLLNN
jgi:hypothetical protein